MTQEALKLALEALERFEGNKKLWPEAITAIKEALAQTERPVDCERCNRLEEHAYDLIAELRVANIKLSMQSKACVYCGQLVAKENK